MLAQLVLLSVCLSPGPSGTWVEQLLGKTGDEVRATFANREIEAVGDTTLVIAGDGMIFDIEVSGFAGFADEGGDIASNAITVRVMTENDRPTEALAFAGWKGDDVLGNNIPNPHKTPIIYTLGGFKTPPGKWNGVLLQVADIDEISADLFLWEIRIQSEERSGPLNPRNKIAGAKIAPRWFEKILSEPFEASRKKLGNPNFFLDGGREPSTMFYLTELGDALIEIPAWEPRFAVRKPVRIAFYLGQMTEVDEVWKHLGFDPAEITTVFQTAAEDGVYAKKFSAKNLTDHDLVVFFDATTHKAFFVATQAKSEEKLEKAVYNGGSARRTMFHSAPRKSVSAASSHQLASVFTFWNHGSHRKHS